MSLLRLTGVQKVYGAGALAVTALRDIDLQLQPGEFAALVGPSGSGKTTLLNLIGGLDRPTAGQIELDGTALSTLSRAALAELRLRRIGFIFQAYNLIPVLTAAENCEFVLELQGQGRAVRRRRAEAMLAAVGLAGLERRFPRELSGGQQQRVAVARALAAEPAVVLADEPTANLDSATAAGLLALMQQLNRERGVTFLFSTHDPQVMERAARRIVLHDGQIVGDDGQIVGDDRRIVGDDRRIVGDDGRSG